MAHCSQCGAAVRDADAFCMICGAAVVRPPTPPAPARPDVIYAPPQPVAAAPLAAPVAGPATAQPAKGSKLGLIAGLVILLGFFLPWVRACGQDLSGYDLATSPMIDNHTLYWVVFLGGAACVALHFLIKSGTAAAAGKAANARLVVAIIGVLPILNLVIKAGSNEYQGLIEVMYGGFLVVLGYIGAIVSFFVTRSEVSAQSDRDAAPPPSGNYWLQPPGSS